MDASEQRRLPKKRLLQSFHLEEAAERETYNSQGESKHCGRKGGSKYLYTVQAVLDPAEYTPSWGLF